MKIKYSLPIFSIAALTILGFSSTGRAADSKLTSKDKSFITDASEAGAAEIQQAELANKKSSNADVKAFADMMIQDHTKAGNKLEAIVTSKGGTVSKSPSAMQKADILLLKAKKDSFDKSYASQALADHKKAVALFESASTGGVDDADLKAFAKKTLPTLKMHLKHAEELNAKFNK